MVFDCMEIINITRPFRQPSSLSACRFNIQQAPIDYLFQAFPFHAVCYAPSQLSISFYLENKIHPFLEIYHQQSYPQTFLPSEMKTPLIHSNFHLKTYLIKYPHQHSITSPSHLCQKNYYRRHIRKNPRIFSCQDSTQCPCINCQRQRQREGHQIQSYTVCRAQQNQCLWDTPSPIFPSSLSYQTDEQACHYPQSHCYQTSLHTPYAVLAKSAFPFPALLDYLTLLHKTAHPPYTKHPSQGSPSQAVTSVAMFYQIFGQRPAMRKQPCFYPPNVQSNLFPAVQAETQFRYLRVQDKVYCQDFPYNYNNVVPYAFIIYQLISQMGNSSLPNGRLDVDILTQFKQIKKDQNGLVLQHVDTQQTYLLKQYTFASDLQYEQERCRFERQIAHGVCDNILSIFKIKTHTIQGLCSTTHKIYAIYEYPQVTLQDEILARLKEEKRFDENQLWSILQSCNTALSYLKSTISLNTLQVYVTPEGQLKAVHNDLIDENYRYAPNQNYYYAPQKIKNFNRSDSQVGLVKEAVFSMGMTLLQTALLQEFLDCYDYSQLLFFEPTLLSFIQSLEEVYSADFIQILTIMLDINPNRRPSFSQIQRLLDNYWASASQPDINQNQSNKNGESLNIQMGDAQKRLLMTSQEDKGIIKNLATVNSNQKESIRNQNKSNTKQPFTHKIVQSVECNYTIKLPEKIVVKKVNKHTAQKTTKQTDKQNLYTDPKLLQMIKKDLIDINKLKQSTLKQTIKYSFLYPQSDSIFSSIQDVKLSYKPTSSAKAQPPSITKPEQKPLEQSLPNIIITSQFPSNKKSQLYHQPPTPQPVLPLHHTQPQHLKTSVPNLVYSNEIDCDGHEYTGYMLNGKKHGQGKLMFDDGAFYQGEFQHDQMNGRGVLYYQVNKPAYDGMWINGQFHGEGVLYNENPQLLDRPFNFKDFDEVEDYWRKYVGEFHFDNKCGMGQLYLTNGEVIEGIFENDLINGKCQFRDMRGKCISGLWEMNRLVKVDQQ